MISNINSVILTGGIILWLLVNINIRSLVYSPFIIIIVILGEFLFLLWGVKVCYNVRNAQSMFDEAKYVTLAIYNITLVNSIMILLQLVLIIKTIINIVSIMFLYFFISIVCLYCLTLVQMFYTFSAFSELNSALPQQLYSYLAPSFIVY